MKALLQRVKKASVSIEGQVHAKIEKGLLIFVGVEKGDTIDDVEWLTNKIQNLRVFEDEYGKMNKSIKDVNGEILVVSQFTLAGSCKKGTRPSFDNAALPEEAKKLYEMFAEKLRKANIPVKTGVFAAMMDIELLNYGPVTFMLEHISS